MEHGERHMMGPGETLEETGEPVQWVALMELGCFKYMVHNDDEGKDYWMDFAFESEFVSDYLYFLTNYCQWLLSRLCCPTVYGEFAARKYANSSVRA